MGIEKELGFCGNLFNKEYEEKEKERSKLQKKLQDSLNVVIKTLEEDGGFLSIAEKQEILDKISQLQELRTDDNNEDIKNKIADINVITQRIKECIVKVDEDEDEDEDKEDYDPYEGPPDPYGDIYPHSRFI